MRAERKKYKKIIDDQGLVGTISNITELTLKSNTTETTSMKSQNEAIEREDLKEEYLEE